MSFISNKKLLNGFSLPEVGLGTWKFGGSHETDSSRDKEWISSLQSAIKMGYTHLDTAEMYGAGHSEELIGEAIKQFKRSSLIIATKVSAENLQYEDVLTSAGKSLKKLGVDQIDLYYIHFPNPDIPIQETMRALDELVDKEKIKNIGVSNFDVAQLKKAQKYSKNKIVANQIEYNLLTRNIGKYGSFDMESEVVPYCQENDIMVVAERPVERGAVSKENPLMEEMSKKYNKTYAQIAINWLVSQKNIVTIPKAESVEHQKENLGSVGWHIEPKDIEKLRTSIEVDQLYK